MQLTLMARDTVVFDFVPTLPELKISTEHFVSQKAMELFPGTSLHKQAWIMVLRTSTLPTMKKALVIVSSLKHSLAIGLACPHFMYQQTCATRRTALAYDTPTTNVADGDWGSTKLRAMQKLRRRLMISGRNCSIAISDFFLKLSSSA